MLKIAVPLSFAFFCLICTPSIAETNNSTESLQSESDRLLELENILLGQLERGSDDKEINSLKELADYTEPPVAPAPQIERKPEAPKTVSASDRITNELRKENARLEREIMELNATLSSLRQDLQRHELNSRQIEALNFPSDNFHLVVQTTKTPTVLRTSPSKYASRVYSVDAGERLRVTIRKGNWYLVQGAGLQAWLPKEDVVEIN